MSRVIMIYNKHKGGSFLCCRWYINKWMRYRAWKSNFGLPLVNQGPLFDKVTGLTHSVDMSVFPHLQVPVFAVERYVV